MIRFSDADALAYRLSQPDREVVFLVGAPMAAPHAAGAPGVPGVSGVVDLIRAEFKANPRATQRLEARLAGAPNAYQAAFQHVIEFSGVDVANRIVREAVLQARLPALRPAKVPADPECSPLENDLDAWHLPPAVRALGQLVAARGEQYGRTVLTTNFDPLLELSVRSAGGQAFTSKWVDDGSLESVHGPGTHVAHLHGYWFGGDTLHAVSQLGQERPKLCGSLTRLFQKRTVVVMAYGGWDDIFTRALREVAADPYSGTSVLWCFYDRDPASIEAKHGHVVEPLRPALDKGRVVLYAGIDCHAFLPELVAGFAATAPELGTTPALHRAFVGREKEREVLLDALARSQPVQILGARKMGKSSLQRWIEDQARALGRRVAFVNARGLAGRSPGELVLAFAEALGCRTQVYDALHEDTVLPDPGAAARVLPALAPAVLLVDEADTLAERADHGFDKGFFDVLRAEGQAGRLQWISCSERDLFERFQQTGLSSQFLNDAAQVVVGALSAAEAESVLADLSPELRHFALMLGGTLPPAVRWMVDRLSGLSGDLSAAETKFRHWIAPLFAGWWQDLSPAHQTALRAVAAGTPADATSTRQLLALGLLVERDGAPVPNGRAWHDFLRAA